MSIPQRVIDDLASRGIVPGATVIHPEARSRDGCVPWVVPDTGKWEKGFLVEGYFVSNLGGGYSYLVHKGVYAEVLKPPPDEEIRVGDTVEFLEDRNSSSAFKKGGYGVVKDVSCGFVTCILTPGNSTGWQYEWGGYTNYVERRSVRKVKGAAPIAAKTKTNEDEVRRSIDVERLGCGEGCAVRAGSSKGRIVVGSVPVGHALRARTGRGRLVIAEVRSTTLRSGHL